MHTHLRQLRASLFAARTFERTSRMSDPGPFSWTTDASNDAVMRLMCDLCPSPFGLGPGTSSPYPGIEHWVLDHFELPGLANLDTGSRYPTRVSDTRPGSSLHGLPRVVPPGYGFFSFESAKACSRQIANGTRRRSR